MAEPILNGAFGRVKSFLKSRGSRQAPPPPVKARESYVFDDGSVLTRRKDGTYVARPHSQQVDDHGRNPNNPSKVYELEDGRTMIVNRWGQRHIGTVGPDGSFNNQWFPINDLGK